MCLDPGHTPGHQSCLVHLQKTGWILLVGDAVHLRDNWDNRRIPYFSTMPPEQKLQTLLSMQRLADLTNFYHAQLWINHEKSQSDKLKKRRRITSEHPPFGQQALRAQLGRCGDGEPGCSGFV